MPTAEFESSSSNPQQDYPSWRPSIHDNPFPKVILPDAGSPEADPASSSSSTTLIPDDDQNMSYARSSTSFQPHPPSAIFRSPSWPTSPGLNFPSPPPPPQRFSISATLPAPPGTPQPSALPHFSHLDAAETLTGLSSQKPDASTTSPRHHRHASLDGSYGTGTGTGTGGSAPAPGPSQDRRPAPPSLKLAIMPPPIKTASGSGTGTTPPLSAAATLSQSQSQSPSPRSPTSAMRFESFSSQIPRLPPILQVEKTFVTTSATQAASAQRRRNDAAFKCPVPGCGSTFTRRFNLRGHLRSHTEEKPYICAWPDCAKGFARQHDCKRHQALHTNQKNFLCHSCQKSFSRMDALNRHLRSSTPCRERSGKELSDGSVKLEEVDPIYTAGGSSSMLSEAGARISPDSRSPSEEADAIGSPLPMDVSA